MVIRRSYQFKNRLSELERLGQELEAFGRKKKIPQKCQYEIHLAVEEHFANIVAHGYTDQNEHIITVHLECENNVVKITVSDDGIPFNPLSLKPPDIKLSMEEREIGGLGVHLTRQCMDQITYQREDNRNILVFQKNI